MTEYNSPITMLRLRKLRSMGSQPDSAFELCILVSSCVIVGKQRVKHYVILCRLCLLLESSYVDGWVWLCRLSMDTNVINI